jgi:hypothetical protein
MANNCEKLNFQGINSANRAHACQNPDCPDLGVPRDRHLIEWRLGSFFPDFP